MGYMGPIGKGNESSSFFFKFIGGEFVSAKRCHLSRRWTLQHWWQHGRRFRGRTTTTTTTTTMTTTKTTTRGGSEAVRNAGRRPDRSQAAGSVRRADAESPKEAAVPRVAAARKAAAKVAKAGVARNVAAAKAAVPSRRRASGRIHERPAASKLIPAPAAADKSIASKRTRSKPTASKRTPGVSPRARRNADADKVKANCVKAHSRSLSKSKKK